MPFAEQKQQIVISSNFFYVLILQFSLFSINKNVRLLGFGLTKQVK